MKNASRLLVLLLLVFASLLVPSAGQAGTYTVRQCDSWTGAGKVTGHTEFDFSTNLANGWQREDWCGSGNNSFGLGVASKVGVTYNQGDVARYKTSLDGTDLIFTAVEAIANIPSSVGYNGWQYRYILHDNGSNAIVIPGIMPLNDTFTYTFPAGQGRTDFESQLKCGTSATCPGSGWQGADYNHINGIKLTINDSSQPLVFAGGTLLGGGIKSGTKTVSSLGVDGLSSGISEVFLYVNGQLTASSGATSPFPGVSCSGSPTYNKLRPCPGTYSKEWTVNTAQAPFTNGANAIATCTIDYSGNAACVNPGTVYIQN